MKIKYCGKCCLDQRIECAKVNKLIKELDLKDFNFEYVESKVNNQK